MIRKHFRLFFLIVSLLLIGLVVFGGHLGSTDYLITLKTNYGDIVFKTYSQEAPKAVKNFVGLAKKDFYDNLTFHQVGNGFMIQGGDPAGDGTGGPGYSFPDELNPESEIAHRGYVRGVVAMANAGPDTNGSQFFIMHQDHLIPYSYTIFGMVVSGQEVVDKIAKVKTNADGLPLSPVIIEDVVVGRAD